MRVPVSLVILLIHRCLFADVPLDPTTLRAGEDNRGWSPAWSPDGEMIAFASPKNVSEDHDSERDIWLIDLDGTEWQLTTALSDDTDPTWSPDGTRIAFASLRDGAWNIYVIDIDDLILHQLTNNAGPNIQPSWSHDGTRIAYVSDGDIYTMDVEGQNKRQITEHGATDGEPAWSPDGTKIAFASERTGIGDIYVFDLVQDALINVTDHVEYEDDPTWSPDGSAIVFVRRIDPGTRSHDHLHMVDLKTGSVHYLNIYATFGGHYNPHWSANGNWIVHQFESIQLAMVPAAEALTVVESTVWGIIKRELLLHSKR